jgi:hypothetical protein
VCETAWPVKSPFLSAADNILVHQERVNYDWLKLISMGSRAQLELLFEADEFPHHKEALVRQWK